MVLRSLVAASTALSACALVACGSATSIANSGATATPSPSATPTGATSIPQATPTPDPGPASVTSMQLPSVASCPSTSQCALTTILVSTDGPGHATLYLRYYLSSTRPSAGNRVPAGASADGSKTYDLTRLTSYRVMDTHNLICQQGTTVYEYVEAFTSPGAPQGHVFGSKAVGPC